MRGISHLLEEETNANITVLSHEEQLKSQKRVPVANITDIEPMTFETKQPKRRAGTQHFRLSEEVDITMSGQQSKKRIIPRTIGNKPYSELTDLRHVHTMKVSNDPIWVLKFRKDGKFLATAGHDGILRVWKV